MLACKKIKLAPIPHFSLVYFRYSVFVSGAKVGEVELRAGGVYSVLVNEDLSVDKAHRIESSKWLIFIFIRNLQCTWWLLRARWTCFGWFLSTLSSQLARLCSPSPVSSSLSLKSVFFILIFMCLNLCSNQAPLSMKSVIVAGWYLSVAFGNIFVIIIAEVKFFKDQVK